MVTAFPFSVDPVESDEKFLNQQAIIREIVRKIERGRSCAVVGGKGMGKTSLLKYLERKYSNNIRINSTSLHTYIPIYFQPVRNLTSLIDLYDQLLDTTLARTTSWLNTCGIKIPEKVLNRLQTLKALQRPWPTNIYEAGKVFERYLGEIIYVIDIDPIIPSPKLVFLLDDVYYINNINLIEMFIKHWLELLDNGNYSNQPLRSYLAVVVTCLIHPLEQFLPNYLAVSDELIPGRIALEPISLEVFDKKYILEILQTYLYDQLDTDVGDVICLLSGGHPLLLNQIMCDIWDDIQESGGIDINYVQQQIPRWIDQYQDIYYSNKAILFKNEMVRPVLELLLDEHEWIIADIINVLKPQLYDLNWEKLRTALFLLKSFGVIRKIDQNTYILSGTLFRLWLKPLKEDKQNFSQIFTHVREFVKQDNLEAALEFLKGIKKYEIEAMKLLSRLSRIKEQERQQIIVEEKANIERNRIASAILELLP